MPPRKPEAADQEAPNPARQEIDWSDFPSAVSSIWRLHRLKLFAAIGLLALVVVGSRSYIVVPVGTKAVIMEFGKVQSVVPDGLHIIKPWITTVRLLSVRVQANSLKAEAVSKDTQKVMTEAVVNWTFKPDKLKETFETVGAEDSMVNAIMLPALNESLKAVTAKRPVADILDKREEIKEEIDEKFRQKMAAYHVNVIDLFLTNLRFEADYEKAIEEKQVAEVEVTTKKNRAEAARQEAKGEADAMRIRAEGEAAAKRALSSTLSQANLQLEWIKAWQAGGSQVPQIITGGQGGGFILDMSKLKGVSRGAVTPEERGEFEKADGDPK